MTLENQYVTAHQSFFNMSITDLQNLGQTGDDILELLIELKDAVKDRDGFDDHDHQMEYVDTTVGMIERLLTNLTQK